MSVPTTRAEFKAWCLRRLGAPVIEINVDDDQVEDRIDEALRRWWDFHFDGTEHAYYKHQVTQDDYDRKYIELPPEIIGAVSLFDVPSTFSNIDNMFNIRYQIAMNDLYTLTSVNMAPYYVAMQHLQFLEQMLVGKQPIRYNRHSNRLYVDADWSRMPVGTWLVVDAYQIVDPTTYSAAWSDLWLQRYACALVKRQWGDNLTKFVGLQLPGGGTYNGAGILTAAQDEIEKLEYELIHSWSLPATDMIG